jgi:flagellar protein FliS
MTQTYSLRSYQSIAAQTAPPGQLILMLYDGAVRFLGLALEGFEHEDPIEFNATINNNILRAQEIIEELNRCLDVRRGGELALTLRGLYAFMDRQLTEANVRKSPDGIRDTLQRLSELRDAWRQMLNQQDAGEDSPALLTAALA